MDVSSLEEEKMVLLEACSPSERVTMTVLLDVPSTYFYLFLPLIEDMGVLLPFSSFKVEVLRVLNIISSHLLPNS